MRLHLRVASALAGPFDAPLPTRGGADHLGVDRRVERDESVVVSVSVLEDVFSAHNRDIPLIMPSH
jgi:hypothetical protein